MTPRRERLALAIVLAASAGLFVVGIGWGLPGPGWDFDEIVPRDVLSALDRGVAKGWQTKYPPLQFYLLAPLYAAALKIVAGLDVALPRVELFEVLFYLTRSVSVAMGLATVWFTYLAARRLVGPRAALLGTAVLVLSPTTVFYAKLGNLDVPYLCWLALSFLLLVRLLERHRPLDYLWVAVAAAAAVATKDQAYGVYAATPFVILPSLRRRRVEEGRSGTVAGLLGDRRPWIALAGGGGAFALFHGLPFGLETFRAHARMITGGYTASYRMFPSSLAGHLDNLELTVHNLAFVFGWPLLLACLAGIWMALRRGGGLRSPQIAAPVLMAVSYQLTFVTVILYQYDRYYLPWAVLLAPFVGLALDRVAAWRRLPRGFGAALVLCLLAWSAWRAVALDLHLLRDARQDAERWLAEHVAPGEKVLGIGPPRMLPRIDRTISWRSIRHDREAAFLADLDATWLVLNGRALWEPGAGRLHSTLIEGRSPFYSRVARFERPLPLDPIRCGEVTSSLCFVNPPIDVFRRQAPVRP